MKKKTSMTNKTHAIWSGIASGLTGYIAYFIALPPQLQTGILGDIIQLLHPSAQPFMAGFTRTLSTLLGIWATYKASQSGPQTPPKNSPTE